jgi:hypothetical protein
MLYALAGTYNTSIMSMLLNALHASFDSHQLQ